MVLQWWLELPVYAVAWLYGFARLLIYNTTGNPTPAMLVPLLGKVKFPAMPGTPWDLDNYLLAFSIVAGVHLISYIIAAKSGSINTRNISRWAFWASWLCLGWLIYSKF